MKKAIIIFTLLGVIILNQSFVKYKKANSDGIKWLNWNELQEAEKREPRKVIVDVFTDWCGWCKRMDASTYKDAQIVKYINQNFYAVRFDAETQHAIHFKNHDYKYVREGLRGYNELAARILNNQMSFPTTVYFDEKMNEIFPVPGYQDAHALEGILNYVASNSYKTTAFDSYEKNFKGKVSK